MNALKLRKWCVWITMLFMAQDFARKVFHWERHWICLCRWCPVYDQYK